MFRVEYLKLENHPQLGNIELFLSDLLEINNIDKPYTSVIIGPNGTGKSYILRSISDIFVFLKHFHDTGPKKYYISYSFHIRYFLNGNYYDIMTSFILLDKKIERIKSYLMCKNLLIDDKTKHPLDYNLLKNYSIGYDEIELPNFVIVNSVMLNDRFIFKNSSKGDFYQYLGLRSTSSTASTRSSLRNLVEIMFSESISNINFINNLGDVLEFLDFEKKFEIEYNTKINKLFFSGELTIEDFKQYFEYWWDEDFKFSGRSINNPIWSKPFYDKYYKEYDNKIEEIVNFLNYLVKENQLVHKSRSVSNYLRINFFENKLLIGDNRKIKLISDLIKLDIINLNGILLNKKRENLNINSISSGEYHMLISLIGIFSKIEENSLILIDEPELSLHPNWQMQYITFLKKVFSKYSSCHFILTSHSHFIVSDLEGKNSSVTALRRNEENKLEANLINADTFGWSAEDILYNVFNVRSTWNPFLEADLTELLGLISNNSRDKDKMQVILDKIQKLQTRENDPLIDIIKEANNYIASIK